MAEQIKGTKHESLPILMQTMEANLMLDRVGIRLSNERPDMPFWTIHDGIGCLEKDSKYIENVIKEETEKAIGLCPAIKTEDWRKKQRTVRPHNRELKKMGS